MLLHEQFVARPTTAALQAPAKVVDVQSVVA